MGGKAFPDPELVLKAFGKTVEARPYEVIVAKRPASVLPLCVVYEGLQDHGFHLFFIDAEEYNRATQFSVSTSIVDGICAVTGDGECVIVCQQYDLQVAYLPNPHGYACDLFSDLCTRFSW